MSSTTWTQEAGMTGDIDSDNVQDLVDQAEDSKDAAAASETAAAASATAAATSEANAASSAVDASSSASDAATSETNAATSATSAASSATSSASSASAASTSASNAATSATAAAASETAAGTSETNAATSATNAASSASDALTQAGNAATSASAASSSATAAASSASAASASQTAAAASETAAAASETAASNSETNAANSETNAATSATNAATSETNAATSASSASTSATAASNAQTAAEAAQAAAEAAQEAIDGTYLGALASDPTVDGNGDAVTTGDWYFNTTDSQAYIYNGSSWDALAPDLVGDTTPQLGGNLDTNGNDIKFGDNDEATFGASDDFRVYHDSTSGHTYLKETGGGSTVLQTNTFVVQNAAGTQNIIHAPEGTSGVDISYNGSTKLSTTPTGIDVTGVITTDGLTTSADITFGDNDKAIFGAGSDLQIYHDGNSWIKDEGDGYLAITTNGSGIYLQKGVSETLAEFGIDGACKLRYDNVTKLATTSTGIDVTGTVTADGLTVDASVNPITAVNGARTGLQITQTGGGTGYVTLTDANESLYFRTSDGTIRSRQTIASNGDISFYEDTGTTPKFFWDASTERLGIGTSSPSRHLSVDSGTTDTIAEFKCSGDRFGYIVVKDSTSSGGAMFGADGTDTIIGTGGSTERMRIDSSGNVGIGTSSPTNLLDVAGTAKVQGSLYISNGGAITSQTSGGRIDFYAGGTYRGGEINSYGGTGGGFLSFRTGTTTGQQPERMRIDSSGNLLVGKTAVGNTTEGITLDGASGMIQSTIANAGGAGQNIFLNRQDADGDFILFRKGNGTIGSIASQLSGGLEVGGNGYLVLSATTGTHEATIESNKLRPASDNTKDLGKTDRRWKDLYLSGGVYLGGTGSANYLDDYETGTFTPSYIGSATNPTVSYGFRIGRYVKIGDLVHCMIRLRTTSVSGGSGDVIVAGLPFTTANVNDVYPVGNLISNAWAANTPHTLLARPNDTGAFLVYGNYSTTQVSNMNTGTNQNQIQVTLTYRTS